MTTRRPSILHVTPYYPPDRIGGVGQVVRLVHEGLLERGYRSEVLTSGTSADDRGVHRIGRSPSRFFASSWRGLSLARSFDVLHVHHGEAIALIALTRALRKRPAILVTLHVSGSKVADSLKAISMEGRRIGEPRIHEIVDVTRLHLRNLLDQIALRVGDSVSFVSRSGAVEVLGERGADAAHVVHNAVSLPPNPMDTSRITHTELLFVGTPAHRKRIGLLPIIFDRVKEVVPEARLRIVGFSEERVPSIGDEFRRRRLSDSVLWEGEVQVAGVASFYDASDVLILPSAYEGLPMVILEAQSHALPCVASRVGGNGEVIVHGLNGYLTEPDNPVALADAVIALLKNPQEREEMGKRGRTRVQERFGTQRQIEQYIRIYGKLVKP